MKKYKIVALAFIIVIAIICIFIKVDYDNAEWVRDDQYTYTYSGNKLTNKIKFWNLGNSNKFLNDGDYLITPILDSKVCYFVSNQGSLTLTAIDDCITYDEKMSRVHYYDLQENGDAPIEIGADPEELFLI